jgi:hypothetical protein
MDGPSVVDEVAFPACVLDRDLRYRYVNAGWADDPHGDRFRPGERTRSLVGRSILDVLPDALRDRWTDALNAILHGRLGHFLDETTEHGPTGERLVVTTASPWIGPARTIDGVLCIRYDLTDARRGAENDAALTDVLEVTRRLQHILGNQLALTLGYVELLTLDSRFPPDLRERVDEALRGVVEATGTLAKLRSLIRLELPPDDPSLPPAHAEHPEDLD